MKLKLYSMLLGAVLFASCNKLPEAPVPGFDVTVDQPVLKAGQEVLFKFSGGADMIAFYPGAAPNDYAFKDGRVVDIRGQGLELSFQTGVSGGTQANQLSVLVSTDFNGNYDDFNSVKTATWTDITDKFVYGTNTTFRVSGKADLSSLVVAGKPLYIGFRYVTKPQAENGLARQWWVQSLVLDSKVTFNGAPVTISNQLAAGFRLVDQNKQHAPARSTISTTRVTLWGNVYKDPLDPVYDPENPIYDKESPSYDPEAVFVPYDPGSPYNDYPSENWAISKPIYVDQVNLGPDWSVAIKGMETNPKDFAYVYTKPGTYKAYFIATNANIHGSKQIIKSVDLTIEP